MKKILAIALTVLIFPATLIAGFNFGLIKAAKKRVDKIDAKVIEEKSATTTPTPDTQSPTVPTGLTAAAISSSQINLGWTASIDNTGIASYKIYRDAGATPIATPTGTTYSDTGLTALTLYSYTVSACDAASNCSAQSLATSTTTLDGQAPTVPTGLMAVAISSVQINLSWTASTDDVGVTSYKIYQDGGATPIATPTGTSYNDTGLISSTTYSYAISACDAAGNCSPQSITVSTTTPDTEAPTVPSNLIAIAVSTWQINLSWPASSDDVGVANYQIYRDGGAIPVATPTGETYNDSGLTAATLYTYTASACDAAGNCSPQSPSVSTTTLFAGGEWVLVPGNATFGTSDFYAMKYEAKNVAGVATSTATTTPWTSITHTAARTACSALGGGSHLITIPEVQTINRNIESQSANWADGTIGSLVSAGGGLKRGNVGITDSASYISAGADYGNNPSAERTLKSSLILSNGGILWDWSGNVYEWVYGAGPSGTLGTPNGITFYTGIGYHEWNSTSSPDLSQERPILGPSNSSWTSSNGMGTFYGGATTDVIFRGGAWGLTTGAGVFSLTVTPTTSSNAGIGFRCAR